jgi:hypothetical protein
MTMSQPSEGFLETIAEIDRLNAADPRQDMAGGAMRPREVVYAERMSDCLAQVYPQASEALRIAARAQHICRWQIARDRFPVGRDGYNAWRSACRDHHATLITQIMQGRGYSDAEIAHVVKLIRKQDLKRDPESQALENVVGVVFVEHYLGEFVASHAEYDDEKLVSILRKTLRKMDAVGHKAIAKLALPPTTNRLINIAKEQV